ncbi:hypothetical protein ACODT3_40160 [Streptomyces sp. 4.24]|uniref:hypothetical protein n=1 Tax=Streptomyces tritrimontium TaxID=3406573 RepID=UPI003BB49D56
MTRIKYMTTAAALAVATTAVPAATIAMAAPAYWCSSSTKTIDDNRYDGPWPDNWDVKVTTCAARSGGTVYAYAEVQWDGPSYYPVDDTGIFDGAKLRLQIKQARDGTDPVVSEADFTALEDRMEDSTPSSKRHGRYRTPTISYRAGPGALADSVLFLDWHGDGHGYQRHEYAGSPTV